MDDIFDTLAEQSLIKQTDLDSVISQELEKDAKDTKDTKDTKDAKDAKDTKDTKNTKEEKRRMRKLSDKMKRQEFSFSVR